MNSNSEETISSDEFNNKNHKIVIKNLDTDISNLEEELEVLKNNRERKKKIKSSKKTKKMEVIKEDNEKDSQEDENEEIGDSNMKPAMVKKPKKKLSKKVMVKKLKKKVRTDGTTHNNNGSTHNFDYKPPKKLTSKTVMENGSKKRSSIMQLFFEAPNTLTSSSSNPITTSSSPIQPQKSATSRILYTSDVVDSPPPFSRSEPMAVFEETMLDLITFNEPKPVSERIKKKAQRHREKPSGEAMIFLSYLTDENVKRNLAKALNIDNKENDNISSNNHDIKKQHEKKFIEDLEKPNENPTTVSPKKNIHLHENNIKNKANSDPIHNGIISPKIHIEKPSPPGSPKFDKNEEEIRLSKSINSLSAEDDKKIIKKLPPHLVDKKGRTQSVRFDEKSENQNYTVNSRYLGIKKQIPKNLEGDLFPKKVLSHNTNNNQKTLSFYTSNPHFFEGKERMNKKPETGIEFYIEKEVIPNDNKSIGKFLFACRSEFDEVKVSDYITAQNNTEILLSYISQVDIIDLDIDIALSRLLNHMKLPGEAQRIDRVVQNFANAFTEANKDFKELENGTAAYALSFSIIMLNTDAHSNQVNNKMTLDQFLENNKGYNGGKNFPVELMTDLYNRIIYDEFKFKDVLFPNAVKKGFLTVKKSKGQLLSRKRWFILCQGVLYESKYAPYIDEEAEEKEKDQKPTLKKEKSQVINPISPHSSDNTRNDLTELKYIHSGARKIVNLPVAVLHVKNCTIKSIDDKSFAIYKDYSQCDIEFNQKAEDYLWQRNSKTNSKENYLVFTITSSGTKRDLDSWIRHLVSFNEKSDSFNLTRKSTMSTGNMIN